MLFKFSQWAISNSAIPLQDKNAELSINSSEAGNLRTSKLVQLLKAEACIDVSFLQCEISKPVSCVQPEKALEHIEVTSSPKYSCEILFPSLAEHVNVISPLNIRNSVIWSQL